jgi:cyanophycinase
MKIKYNFFFTFLAILFVNVLSAQNGKLLLVGGGGEEEGGWSNPPYTWAINNSVNKKVAVISFTTQTTWLPNYFLSLGAVAAKNFTIDASNANLQSTYDSLMNYDVFFIKGGDQYNYYSVYKNTFTQNAIQDKFNSGGVIAGTSAGMAILSNIFFTAENGTVYPEEVLENINNTYMTLNDDFLNLFPGYIFDTHFVERARLPRLMGFLAKWKQDRGEAINGIGVDDRTALAIYTHDGIKKGKVFGTGAVTFINTVSSNNLVNCNNMLSAENINYSQLLNGDSLNFPNTYFQNGYETIAPQTYNNNFPFKIVLSGENLFQNNQIAIQNYLSDAIPNERITIITDTVSPNVLEFKNYFNQQGFVCEEPLLITSAGLNSPNWNNLPGEKFVLIENEFDTLRHFFENHPSGLSLLSRLSQNSYWVGDNAMYPTSLVFKNFKANFQAYYGNIEIKKGLDILKGISIFPSAFSNEIDVENGASILPYAMLSDTINKGFYLNGNVCLSIYRLYGLEIYLKHLGNFPSVMLETDGPVKRKFSNTTSTGTGNPRMVAGFGNMIFSTLCNNDSILIGVDASIKNETQKQSIKLFPNPAKSIISIELVEPNTTIEIFDSGGVLKSLLKANSSKQEINIQEYSNGIYFIKTSSEKGVKYQKFIKLK